MSDMNMLVSGCLFRTKVPYHTGSVGTRIVASKAAINDNNVRLPIKNKSDLDAFQSLWSWSTAILQLSTPASCKVDVGVEYESKKSC